MKLRLVFGTKPQPEFRACGLALQNIQFACFNVVGMGASTKPKALINWVKQVWKEL